jgi:hypothetical protein
MAQTRYSAQFKVREDILDSITPLNMVQDDAQRPSGPWRVAAWLPVQFTKSNTSAGTDAFVISAFKPVAFSTEGHVVPAGMRTALGGNSSSGVFAGDVLTYTSDDVSYGVIDLTTGEAVTAPIAYSGEEVCDALITRGLVLESDATGAGATVPVAADADVNKVIDLFVSEAIGFVLQDVYVWSGRPEDGDQVFLNYSMQDRIMFYTEGQLRLPQRVAGSTSSDSFTVATLDGGGSTVFAAGSMIAAGEYWDASNFTQLTRYSAVDSAVDVVALGLAQRPVAKITDRTPMSCNRSGVLVRERSSVTAVTKEGDFFLDAEVGVLFLHQDTWDTLVALGVVATTFTYKYYTDTGLATGQRFPHFDGPCRPGDFVTVDAQSNFTKASSAVVSAGLSCGRVLEVRTEPYANMDLVKSAWTQTGFSKTSKMPGSATKGFSDLITLSDEVVADKVVVINFKAPH